MSRIIKVINWLSLLFAGAIVFASLAFAYVLLVPLDVLNNWTLKVEDKVYHSGDEIVLNVTYTKERDVTGKSYYYLECKRPNGANVRFPMSQSEGNRPKGSGNTDLTLRIPSDIPDLPTSCRIAVSIDYNIYTFRKFTENNISNDFRVEERL